MQEGRIVRGPNGERGIIRNGQIVPMQDSAPAPQNAGVPQMVVPPQPKQPAPVRPVQEARDQVGLQQDIRDLNKPVPVPGHDGYFLGPDGRPFKPEGLPDKPSPAQVALDKRIGDEYADYKLGGFADVRKQIDQVGAVHDMLGKQGNLTGPIVGMTPDRISSFINQDAIDARQGIEEIVQRSMKKILGAQFTEKEAAELIKRTYNPSLDESRNRVRVGRLLKQIKDATDAKEDAFAYFEQHGTLQGWDGRLYNNEDFDPDNLFNEDGSPRGGFTDEHRQKILEYLPKAKNPEDLMEFARNLSRSDSGATTIGNAAEVLRYVRGGGDPNALTFSPADNVQMPKDDGGDDGFQLLGIEDE